MEPNTPEIREAERPMVERDSQLKPHALISASIILASLIIAGSILYTGGHPSATGAATDTTQTAGDGTQSADISKVKIAGEPYYGNQNAPVAIAYWTDYQCPFCQRNEQQVLPQIIKDYVATGKAKIVFKDFPFLGNDSVTGAEYGRAVWKLYPNQYFAWRTAMFNAQDAEGDTGFGNAASIDKLDATIPGLDAAKITADVAANKAAYDALANADKAEGASMGIQGTPGTVIGQTLIPGAYPYDTFKSAIEAALK